MTMRVTHQSIQPRLEKRMMTMYLLHIGFSVLYLFFFHLVPDHTGVLRSLSHCHLPDGYAAADSGVELGTRGSGASPFWSESAGPSASGTSEAADLNNYLGFQGNGLEPGQCYADCIGCEHWQEGGAGWAAFMSLNWQTYVFLMIAYGVNTRNVPILSLYGPFWCAVHAGHDHVESLNVGGIADTCQRTRSYYGRTARFLLQGTYAVGIFFGDSWI